VELQAYTDADLALTEALETDPEVMRELGGPIERNKLPGIHRRRLADPWWFKIVVETDGPAVGTIGVWETRHGGEMLHETGWMVLPAHQGRGIASAALTLLIARVRAEPRFPSIHAFPPVTNAPSNALCRKSGFTCLGQTDFVYSGRTLRCNHWALETRDQLGNGPPDVDDPGDPRPRRG
jgi:RimJ/RimL family protein N-acetyltransferase